MVNIWIVLAILFFHWLFDFVFQTDYQAKNKSKQWDALLTHTMNYSFSWAIAMLLITCFTGQPSIELAGKFMVITFIFHTITDYFTSRLNSKLWNEGKVHQFFVSLGIDQWYHMIQLLLTYYYLTN